jgi:Protein O-mannosyl-transferase TMEM260-like
MIESSSDARAVGREPRRTAERGAGVMVCAFLLLVYLVSLAPDVTLWDAGEFNAAIATLGIPHPPGTPLYVLVASVWARLLPLLSQVVAVNALSAVATAAACGLLARRITAWTRSAVSGIAAGVTAGIMFSVWQNATETEVYALSLLLAISLLVVGDRAGRTGSVRHVVLLAYLMALSIPLQISALVSAPAAILLASTTDAGRISRERLVSLGAVFAVVVGLGVGAAWLVVAGALVLFGLSSYRLVRRQASHVAAWRLIGVIAVGASAVAFMLIRAAHDPGVNQGDPSRWRALADVVARRQYDVPPLWPRRAPVWLQLGNLVQYSDWQVAAGLDSSPGPSWLRTPWTIAFGLLAAVGARWHWNRERRSATAMAVLFACASLGVVGVLNLRAGPSIGIGVLPADAVHEPRERDYFFALAFVVAGAWAGMGGVAVAGHLGRRRRWLGLATAVPLALNWQATDRRRQPDAALTDALGVSLLSSSPPRAVLLLAGDNDSYATWFEQQVHDLRKDVTPITLPLLGADWYRAELARRDSLLPARAVAEWVGSEATLRLIREQAERLGRPVVAAVSIPRQTREAIARDWVLSGMVFVERGADPAAPPVMVSGAPVDERAVRTAARGIAARVPQLLRPARDPAGTYVQQLLSCPSHAVREIDSISTGRDGLLDSWCNLK